MWSCPFQVKPTMLCSLYVALSGVTTPSGLKILDITAATSSTNGVTNIVYREIFNDLGTGGFQLFQCTSYSQLQN